MSTVVASTPTNLAATAFCNQRKLDRCQNGNIVALWADTTANGVLKYSADNGATWASAAPDIAGFNNGSMFVDLDDYIHVVWYQSGTGGGRSDTRMYYMRGTPSSARTAWTWGAAVLVLQDVSQTGAGSNYGYPDLIAHREGSGWCVAIVASYYRSAGNNVYTVYVRLIISATGVITYSRDNLPNFSGDGTAGYFNTDYQTGKHTFPSIDFNHAPDGKTVAGGTPHYYVAWSAGAAGAGKGIRFIKGTYSGGSWTWGIEREIDNTVYILDSQRWINCIFDGTRVIIPGMVETAPLAHNLILHERDAADTTTTLRTLVAGDSSGTNAGVWSGSAAYDVAGNVCMLGLDYNNAATRYRRWNRATATLEAVVTLSTETVPASGGTFATKRSYSIGNRIEWIYESGTASPYTVKYESRIPDVVSMGGGYGS